MENLIIKDNDRIVLSIPIYRSGEQYKIQENNTVLRNKKTYDLELQGKDISNYQIFINEITHECKIENRKLSLSNHFGYIQLFLANKSDSSEVYHTDYIDICVDKMFFENYIEAMLNYVVDNDMYLCDQTEIQYTFLNSWIKEANSAWEKMLSIYEEIQTLYEKLYTMFQSKKKYEHCNNYIVDDFYKARDIDNKTIADIVTHPDQLIETHKGGIQYGNRFYIPKKILQHKIEPNYNVYENKIVLSFLKHVIYVMQKQIKSLKNETPHIVYNNAYMTDEYVSVPNIVNIKFHEKYTKAKIQTLMDLLKQFESLYYKYKECLQCDDTENMEYLPPPTTYIFYNRHYLDVYIVMQSFYKQADFDAEAGLRMYKNLYKSNTLYEYYILCKLINVIKNKCKIDAYLPKYNSHTIYEFCGNKFRIRLLYQCKISTLENKNTFTRLYRSTTWNSNSSMPPYKLGKDVNYYCPDYVVEIEKGNKFQYYIIDAKFSNWKIISPSIIREIIVKYGICISPIEIPGSDVTIEKVGIIYGQPNSKSENEAKFILQNKINNQYTKPTLYFAYKLSPTDKMEEHTRTLLELLNFSID